MRTIAIIRKALLFVAALLLAGALAVFAWQTLHEPGRTQQALAPADRAAQLRQGEYLVRAGNCMGCHTTTGGQQYAGGRAVETPFGRMYAPNISPDKASGIGSWSADDFWRAIHNGKSKDGRFLYPAFPYPSYTKVRRADADAMYAYLMSRPAVRQDNLEHALAFPYNQRPLLAFWRARYFTPGEYLREPLRGEQWNRGAYLVQGLGHCAACHTARDAWGGPRTGRELDGAMLPGASWYASSLTSDPQTGIGAMPVAQLAALLKDGVTAGGAVHGPMADVVAGSLQYLSPADALAIASYLKAVPAGKGQSAPAFAYAPPDPAAFLATGRRIFENNCAACHMDQGQGHGTAYPALAGKRSLGAAPATNAIRMVLHGGFAPSTAGNPRPFGMPPFSHALDDEQVAAVVSYLRTSWGNQGTMVSAREVNRLRAVPLH